MTTKNVGTYNSDSRKWDWIITDRGNYRRIKRSLINNLPTRTQFENYIAELNEVKRWR